MTVKKISRAHWEQIMKRCRRAKFVFDSGFRCLICGKNFKGHECTHSITDNEEVLRQALARQSAEDYTEELRTDPDFEKLSR